MSATNPVIKNKKEKEKVLSEDDKKYIADFEKLSIHEYFNQLDNVKLSFQQNTKDTVGRGVYATKNIKKGELVLSNTPILAIVRDQMIENVCHFCLKYCPTQIYQCSDCEFYRFCSNTCLEDSKKLHVLECDSLAKLKMNLLKDQKILLIYVFY